MDGKKNHTPTSRDNFYYFINTIYNFCKNQDIRPTIVIQWIQDLIDFSPLLYSYASNNAIEFESNFNETGELQNLNIDKKPLFRKSEDTRNEKEIQIPFVSEISGYIEQKKLKVIHLDTNIKNLQQQVRELEEQENILASKLISLKKKKVSP